MSESLCPLDHDEPRSSADEQRWGRCVIASRHGEEPAEAEVGLLCFDCFTTLRKSLEELPAIAGWLHVNIAAGGESGERVAGTREDPIPLRQDVLDLIGPDSRHYVSDERLPLFLLFDGAEIIGAFDSWRAADAAWRDVMLAAGVPKRVVAMLRKPFTREEWRDLPDEDKAAMDAAHTRWQIRPTEVGGSDQRGEDAIRNRLFGWVQIITEESKNENGKGFSWPERCDDIPTLVAWLTARLSWIAGQLWVDEMFDELRRTAGEAHRIAPWRAETRRDTEPCVCGVRAVVWHIAEGFTRCERGMGGCGREQMVTEHQMNAQLPETRKAAG